MESSLTGLTVGAGAIGGPVAEYVKASEVMVVGGAGCRAMNEGMRIARSVIASGRTVRRYGSRQTNVYTARNERVCDHCFQLSRRITLA